MDGHPVNVMAITPGRSHVRGEATEYTEDEMQFMMAMEKYKREKNPYPSYAEVLEVAKSLGYRKDQP